MSYTYDTSHTSASVNWMKGRNGNKIEGITIHHWGSSSNLDFYGIVNFLCSPRPANPTSAHYVVQGRTQAGKADRRVACIVDPDDTAYHAGNWQANLTEIGIECRPYPTAADYDVIAELVAKLWTVYGVVPLYPHKHWTSTECPGEYDVAKVQSLAKAKYAVLISKTTPTPPKPVTKENTVLTDADLSAIWGADKIPAPGFAPDKATNPTWGVGTVLSYTLDDAHAVRGALTDPTAGLIKKVDDLTALVNRLIVKLAA